MKKVAIIRVTNGIGNQLFQYAFARSLSLRFGFRALLDVSWFWIGNRGSLMRPYRGQLNNRSQRIVCHLSRFNLAIPMTRLPVRSLVRAVAPRKFHRAEIEMRYFSYDAVLMDRLRGSGPSVITLDGYWQSIGYLHGIRERLREEISPRAPYENRILAAFAPRPCAAIHVRRGDIPAKFAGLCKLDYYETAIRHIRARVDRPKFLIFTDDMDWVKTEFCARLQDALGDAHIVDNRSDLRNFLDMRTYCRHFIIANSTFSWWPAYLSPHEDTIVVAPRYWLRAGSWTPELHLRDWVCIENTRPE